MVDIAGHYDEQAEASTGFDPIPAGAYRAKIIESSVEDISKSNPKGRCLALTWQIETGPHDGRLIWQRLSMWAENMTNLDKVVQIANSQFAAIREATGRMAPRDTEELHHIPCTINVGVRVDPNGVYSPQNEVKSVKAVTGDAPANAGSRSAGGPPARTSSPSATGQSGQRSAPWPSRGHAARQEEDIPF